MSIQNDQKDYMKNIHKTKNLHFQASRIFLHQFMMCPNEKKMTEMKIITDPID